MFPAASTVISGSQWAVNGGHVNAMNWSALSSLPVWAQASRSSNAPGVLTTATVQGGLVTFLLGARVTSKAAETTEVIHFCIQEGKEFLQRKLLVDVKFPSKDVKDVGPEPFQQILVACGARALALFSPSCCAVVALPLETARMDAPQRCEALVLSPRQGLSFIKVAWHQRSDAHLGVLSSDGSWSLLNLALSLDEAEVYFPALGPDPFVDFLFVAPSEDETPEDAWLSMTVFFLTAAGRISFRTPVIPSATVLSHSSYEALQVALAYAGSVDTFAAAVAGSMTAVAKENVVLATHRHHLHAAASTSFSHPSKSQLRCNARHPSDSHIMAGDGKEKGPAKTPKLKKNLKPKTKQPVRLYAKGVILGYKRSKSNCYSNCTLLKIDGVRTKEDTQFYVGKRVAYVYKAKKELQGSKFRVMWGKVRRSHGNSGVVRAKFGKSIPPKAFGAACRVMLYPSSI
eukprot:symbB.v1.2.010161.t1/scaffold659.1/size175721/2